MSRSQATFLFASFSFLLILYLSFCRLDCRLLSFFSSDMKVYDEKNGRCGRLREGMVKICLRCILVLEEERLLSQFIPTQSQVKALTFEARDKDRQSICRILSVVRHHRKNMWVRKSCVSSQDLGKKMKRLEWGRHSYSSRREEKRRGSIDFMFFPHIFVLSPSHSYSFNSFSLAKTSGVSLSQWSRELGKECPLTFLVFWVTC